MIFNLEQRKKLTNCYNEEGEPLVSAVHLRFINSGLRKCSPALARKLSRITGVPKEDIRPDLWGD